MPLSLIDDLLRIYPQATGRDIKMLLPLALKVAKSKDTELSLIIIRQCAVFRGLVEKEAAQ